mmetsp:Transcript_24726/g.98165  ORF Transcript_24726/g.98165 Transcript_24726/m.98165 type:complete len:209 (-) Transcript_24726:697-1323(-)
MTSVRGSSHHFRKIAAEAPVDTSADDAMMHFGRCSASSDDDEPDPEEVSASSTRTATRTWLSPSGCHVSSSSSSAKTSSRRMKSSSQRLFLRRFLAASLNKAPRRNALRLLLAALAADFEETPVVRSKAFWTASDIHSSWHLDNSSTLRTIEWQTTKSYAPPSLCWRHAASNASASSRHRDVGSHGTSTCPPRRSRSIASDTGSPVCC